MQYTPVVTGATSAAVIAAAAVSVEASTRVARPASRVPGVVANTVVVVPAGVALPVSRVPAAVVPMATTAAATPVQRCEDIVVNNLITAELGVLHVARFAATVVCTIIFLVFVAKISTNRTLQQSMQ